MFAIDELVAKVGQMGDEGGCKETFLISFGKLVHIIDHALDATVAEERLGLENGPKQRELS